MNRIIYIFTLYLNLIYGRFIQLKKSLEVKKKHRLEVDTDFDESASLNIVPTTDPNADLASGEDDVREPSVRNRSLINLTVDDLNWTRSIEGFIHNIEVGEKRAVLQLQDGNQSIPLEYILKNISLIMPQLTLFVISKT